MARLVKSAMDAAEEAEEAKKAKKANVGPVFTMKPQKQC